MSSAFAVFKSKKANSSSALATSKPSKKKSRKSGSVGTSPSTSHSSLSTIIKGLDSTSKKKQKAEIKQIKHLLKSAGKKHSFLPDSANHSPLLDKFELKKQSTSSLRSTRAKDNTKSENRKDGSGGNTPPLPPRNNSKQKPQRSNNTDGIVSPGKRKRTSELSSSSSQEDYNGPCTVSINPPTSGTPTRRPQSSLQPFMHDSVQEAERLLESLIHPVSTKKFFSELFEKKPLLVKRHKSDYNAGWFSTQELHDILVKEQVNFTENLDVVSYENGQRETHNPEGRAYAPVVWDYYQNGCSVRMLNPQSYSKDVWRLLSVLQEYFGCCVGANMYLTPPGTQGFAPHYDDIDAFILQLEGKKHWRLYDPRTENETLPRFSSGNFSQDEIGEPILDAIVEAGDLLYFPRGVIHQGETLSDSHSLHITVSVNQLNTWGDLLEKMLPRALQVAMEEDVEFRKALPRNYLSYMGVAFSDAASRERQGFMRVLEQLMTKLTSYAPVDSACDQMGKKYIFDSLPPLITEEEKKCSVHGNGERWDGNESRVCGAVEIDPDTCIKVIRKGCLRLITEDDKVVIYHNLENSRVYHAVDSQCVLVTPQMASAIEYLLHSYPEFISVDSLPMESLTEKLDLASSLYDRGLIVTQTPLETVSGLESDDDS